MLFFAVLHQNYLLALNYQIGDTIGAIRTPRRDNIRTGMHYTRNFLSNVIMRLDFPQVDVLLKEDKPEFSGDISDRFPEATSQQLAQLQFNMHLGHSPDYSQQVLGYKWDHKNEPDGKKVVVLTPTFLSLEYASGLGAYEHFPEFRENLEAVFAAFTNRYEVEHFTRLGLRYINEIVLPRGDPLDWGGLINAELITSVLAGSTENTELTRSMHQYSGKRDDISFGFVYGIKNPEYPNAVTRREFVLDYDCYMTGVVETTQVLSSVASLNALASELFEMSIEDGLREIMGVSNNG